ncbi:MAG: threonine synthase [Candidatus Aminicenantia bacterium]
MNNKFLGKLLCFNCGKEYLLNSKLWRCECGAFLDIYFENKIEPKKIDSKKFSMWRYREVIPVENDENIISFEEGFTPLTRIEIFGKEFFIKLDFLFPTGSFKDRGASVLVSKLKELGIKKVVEDSSGNAGCSISAYCAKAGIECEIFVPENISPSKLVQLKIYGAKVMKVKGGRNDVANLALKSAESSFYASHVFNPFFFQGTKTFSYEIWEQLGHYSPDFIILPLGNGTLLLGAYIGFKELFVAGLIKKIPSFIAVQTSSCSPIYRILKENLSQIPDFEPKRSIADGIAVSKPRRWAQIVDVIRSTNGDVITVEEEEIVEASFELSRRGIYVEPTSATSIAGIKKFSFKEDEVVVVPLTGSGLKATDNYLKFVEV